jgi:hypothetical protein
MWIVFAPVTAQPGHFLPVAEAFLPWDGQPFASMCALLSSALRAAGAARHIILSCIAAIPRSGLTAMCFAARRFTVDAGVSACVSRTTRSSVVRGNLLIDGESSVKLPATSRKMTRSVSNDIEPRSAQY